MGGGGGGGPHYSGDHIRVHLVPKDQSCPAIVAGQVLVSAGLHKQVHSVLGHPKHRGVGFRV